MGPRPIRRPQVEVNDGNVIAISQAPPGYRTPDTLAVGDDTGTRLTRTGTCERQRPDRIVRFELAVRSAALWPGTGPASRGSIPGATG